MIHGSCNGRQSWPLLQWIQNSSLEKQCVIWYLFRVRYEVGHGLKLVTVEKKFRSIKKKKQLKLQSFIGRFRNTICKTTSKSEYKSHLETRCATIIQPKIATVTKIREYWVLKHCDMLRKKDSAEIFCWNQTTCLGHSFYFVTQSLKSLSFKNTVSGA